MVAKVCQPVKADLLLPVKAFLKLVFACLF